MAFTLVTVSATYLEPDNVTPLVGTVSFQLAQDITDGAGGRILASRRKVGTLNGSGVLSVQIAATDDATTAPQNAVYLVTESFVGVPTNTYFIEVPSSSPTLNLALAAHVNLPSPYQAMFEAAIAGSELAAKEFLQDALDAFDTGVLSVNGETGVVDLSGTFASIPDVDDLGVNARRSNGVVGSPANDTSGLQGWLNEAALGAPEHLVLRGGPFKITAPLVVPQAPGTVVSASGRRNSRIVQYTAGQPVLKFVTPDTHTMKFSGLSLEYDVPQTNPGSVAVLFHAPGGSSSGFYHLRFHDIDVFKAYVGFGCADADGSQTVWDTVYSDINFYDIKHSAVRLVPATPVGMPNVKFRDIGIFNTGGAVVSTGPALDLLAAEATIDGLDLEGWYNEAFSVQGGTPVKVSSLHVEHHKFAAAFSRLAYIANGPFKVDGFSISGATTAGNTDGVYLFQGDAGARVTLDGGVVGVDTTLGTAYIRSVVHGSAVESYSLHDVTVTSGGLVLPSSDAPTVAKTWIMERPLASSALYLDGTAGNYVSAPDSAGLSITGDIDIRVKVALNDWSPAATNMLVAKDESGQRSYFLAVSGGGGALELGWFSGAAFINKVSTVGTGFVDGTAHWVRATIDVNNGAAGNTVTFYTSEDGISWTQLGAPVVTAGTTSIDDTTSALEVGANFLGSNGATGKFYQVEVRSGIGGTVVASPDFRRPVDPRHADAQGNIWSFTGSAWAWAA